MRQFDEKVQLLANKFKGQLKTFRIGLNQLAGQTVQAICYNCPNLEILGFGHVDIFDVECPLNDSLGFARTPQLMMAFNSLTKLRVLGLDCFRNHEQNSNLTLKELDISSLQTLSLCNSSFVTNELVLRCFEANSTLNIKLEDGKFDEQVFKEFEDKKYKLVTVLVDRKIPYYKSDQHLITNCSDSDIKWDSD